MVGQTFAFWETLYQERQQHQRKQPHQELVKSFFEKKKAKQVQKCKQQQQQSESQKIKGAGQVLVWI